MIFRFLKMSSVHYKFKATLEYKTLTFDGLHIGVDELKKAICDKENIRTESFDLLLTNAHTKREYTVGELVPRNSSVVVQRVPRENAQKLPKVQDTSTSGIVQRGFMQHAQSSYVNPDDFARMSEEQRLAHIKQVSTEKYSAANYQRRPSRIMDGPPPPTYVCNRCNQSGHWYKSCPLVNTRKTTGIPMEELMETTQDDPNAMLHPSGRFVKPIMHHQARLQRKHEAFPGQPDNGGGSPYTGDDQIPVPEVYKCALCKGLQRDAVLAACCGNSFCAECYQQQLLTHPNEPCPGSDCTQQISADSLVPNKGLRAAIQKYLNEVGTGAELSMDRSGVNKPNVLTDTQSLLHKLMPDLANAQAKRELATAGRSPLLLDSSGTEGTSTPPLRVVLSIPPPTSKPSPLFGNLQQQQPQAVQQQAGPTPPAQNLPTSQMVPPIPGLPMFDPKKPPPPIIPATQNGAAGSVPGGVPVTAISPAPSMNHTPPITAGVQVVAAPSPLPAEALTQVWESFLKRKDEESAARNAGNGHGGGLFGKTTPIVNLQIGSSTMTTTTEQQQSKAVTPISVGPTAAGDGGIELLRPSSRDAQQLQVTTGLEPPGIGADSSLVRIPPQLAADSLSNNLMLSAAHQTAIRALGPNASACEITDVWKTFLRMKDSQQQKRHHSSHYADFPERRRFLRVKDSQPHKRHHSSSHYAVSPERRRHSWDDEKRAEEKDRNKKPYKKDKDEPEERKKKRAKPDEEEQHDEEDHERKKEKRAKEEPDGKKEKQHKKDEDRHEEKKKRLSMDEDEHHDGKKGKQAKPDEEEHDGKKEKRDKKDKEEHKRKEKRTKPDGDDKNKEENEEKPIKADEEMEEKRVKPDDQKHEEKEKQSKPDEEEEKINEDEQEEDKMWKQTMVEVEPAKKNLMQEELANKREENALEKREEANEEKRLKNDGEEEKHPKKKRSKKDKGKKDEKKSRKKHSDGKDRKKKRHKKDKEELRKRKRTRTDEEEQDEAERDRKKEKRDKRTKKHKKEKKSSRKHREKDDHDDK